MIDTRSTGHVRVLASCQGAPPVELTHDHCESADLWRHFYCLTMGGTRALIRLEISVRDGSLNVTYRDQASGQEVINAQMRDVWPWRISEIVTELWDSDKRYDLLDSQDNAVVTFALAE